MNLRDKGTSAREIEGTRGRGRVKTITLLHPVHRDHGRTLASLEKETGVNDEVRPLNPREKVALVAEILAAYARMYRTLRHPNVVEVVRRAREVRRPRARPAGAVEHLVARRMGRVVGRTLRLLPTDSRCLIQSLVVTRLLARRSIPCKLVVGVRRGEEFEAHAWVEHEGIPVLPSGEYMRLMEL